MKLVILGKNSTLTSRKVKELTNSSKVKRLTKKDNGGLFSVVSFSLLLSYQDPSGFKIYSVSDDGVSTFLRLNDDHLLACIEIDEQEIALSGVALYNLLQRDTSYKNSKDVRNALIALHNDLQTNKLTNFTQSQFLKEIDSHSGTLAPDLRAYIQLKTSRDW